MQFSQIQDSKTYEISAYFVDGKRVSARKYNATLDAQTGAQNCFLTVRTRTGNFKHSFYKS